MKNIAGDIILYMCTKNHNHTVWFLGYGVRQTHFFVILGQFFPFYPLYNPENQNFEKMKKTFRYFIILHTCTKNHDHIMYAS